MAIHMSYVNALSPSEEEENAHTKNSRIPLLLLWWNVAILVPVTLARKHMAKNLFFVVSQSGWGGGDNCKGHLHDQLTIY